MLDWKQPYMTEIKVIFEPKGPSQQQWGGLAEPYFEPQLMSKCDTAFLGELRKNTTSGDVLEGQTQSLFSSLWTGMRPVWLKPEFWGSFMTP